MAPIVNRSMYFTFDAKIRSWAYFIRVPCFVFHDCLTTPPAARTGIRASLSASFIIQVVAASNPQQRRRWSGALYTNRTVSVIIYCFVSSLRPGRREMALFDFGQ
jgi:hypothetical protein